MKEILRTYSIFLSGYIDTSPMRSVLNTAIIGDANCNEWIDGKIVGKQHPRMQEVEKAHYMLCPNIEIEVEFDLFIDGSFGNFRVKEEE